MSKTAEAVSSFLSELCSKLRPLGDADLAEMLSLKEAEVFTHMLNQLNHSLSTKSLGKTQQNLQILFP